MLYGTFQHVLDAKGRVNFPAKFREDLGDRFFLCKGLGDQCLYVYSEAEFEKLREKVEAQPLGKAKQLRRFLFAGATDVETDKQGRIIIPAPLRDYARLQKDVVIIGASTRAEIWDRELWEECDSQITPEFIQETMLELGL